jgi:hypothetical protein
LGHSLVGIVIKKVRTASSYNIENLLTSKQALLIAQSRPKQWGDILTSVVHLLFWHTPSGHKLNIVEPGLSTHQEQSWQRVGGTQALEPLPDRDKPTVGRDS